MAQRRRRMAAVAVGAAALVVLGAAPAPAQTQTPGAGASSGTASVLRVRLGDGALDLRLVEEGSETTNVVDGRVPEAVERLTALTAASTLAPQLASASTPPLEVRSTGSEESVAAPGVDLASVAADAGVPGLLGGTLQGPVLRSLVDQQGALASAEGGGGSDVTVLGGLVALDGVEATLGSNALLWAAGAARAVTADRVEVLDLDALLQALGISLGDLPVGVAAGLLAQLGLPLPGGFGSPAELVAHVEELLAQAGGAPAQVDALRAQLDGLLAEADALTSQLGGLGETVTSLEPLTPVCDAAAPILDTLGIGCDEVEPTLETLTGDAAVLQAALDGVLAQVDALRAQLDGLLDQVVGLLRPVTDLVDGLVEGLSTAPLLVLEDVSVGALATAAPTVAESVAELTGSIGSFRIGSTAVPGLDLLAGADAADAAAANVAGALGAVLATIDPSLAGLVDVDLLERSSSVGGVDGATEAVASLVGLRVTLTPPDLCGLLSGPDLGPTLAGVVGGLGQSLPPLPDAVTGVLDTLGSTVTCDSAGTAKAALSQPLTVEALTVEGRAAFGAVQTEVPPPPQQPLARTGLGEHALLLTGAAALLLAYAARRIATTGS